MTENQQRMDGQNLRDQFLFSYKIDRMYANALGFVRKSSALLLTVHLVKTIYLAGTFVWYSRQHSISGGGFFPPLVSAAGLSLVMVFVIFVLILTTRNLAKNLIIAKDLDHIVEEPFDPNLRFNVFEDSISNVYNSRDHDDIERNQMAQKILADVIKHYYFVISKNLNVVARFADVFLFGISIWLAVLLGTQQVETRIKVLIICYIVVQFLLEWKLLLVFLVVALSPLILCFICCFVICCMPKKKRDFLENLNPIEYRESVQLQHGVECLICFMNFYPDEKICILECPAKHAFHQICIKTWFQVGSTCPVCRHEFATNDGII